MKFRKKYHEHLESEARRLRLQGCLYVEFKRHKKLLRKCPSSLTTSASIDSPSLCSQADLSACLRNSAHDLPGKCSSSCVVCEESFFPTLMDEISAVVDWFNARAQQLLDNHLASGFGKILLLLTRKAITRRDVLIQEGRTLVNFASMNAIAIRKILKKYDKVHACEKGLAFRMRLQTMHVELLQSPWLIELAALYINLSDSNTCKSASQPHEAMPLSLPDGFAVCEFEFDEEKPVISCTLLASLKLEFDLTCSICLDTVFDPVSLVCGHIFCYGCACSAASVLTVEGLKAANRGAKCPLCRQDNVYKSAVFLAELNVLIKNRCTRYWEERLQRERAERLQHVKEHWDKQTQAVMGL